MTTKPRLTISVDDMASQPLCRLAQGLAVATKPSKQQAPARDTRPLPSNPRDPFPGLVTR